ncbi:cytochrome c oxidase subunit 8C, mitochondrial [Lutra lutra]|uniref:cytochrome c oxidase subunit 8C, mitochondrial n=1 Tax=Lutra lutra TaxID=9657 RepID=UPI001FD09B41|nr:cytochrome c oxidase subunit 8C, mitochondrial [Lutra lutra]
MFARTSGREKSLLPQKMLEESSPLPLNMTEKGAPAQTRSLEARAIVLYLVRALLSTSPRFASAEAMPRLLVFCLLPRRRVTPLGLQIGRRLTRLEPRRRQRPKSSTDTVIGLVVLFATFLVPCGYVLSNLREFRRE